MLRFEIVMDEPGDDFTAVLPGPDGKPHALGVRGEALASLLICLAERVKNSEYFSQEITRPVRDGQDRVIGSWTLIQKQ